MSTKANSPVRRMRSTRPFRRAHLSCQGPRWSSVRAVEATALANLYAWPQGGSGYRLRCQECRLSRHEQAAPPGPRASAACRRRAAQSFPSYLAGDVAPCLIRRAMAASLSRRAAQCRTVSFDLLMASIRASCSSNSSIMSTQPLPAARWSGVLPLDEARAFTCAPWLTRALAYARLPLSAAWCRAEPARVIRGLQIELPFDQQFHQRAVALRCACMQGGAEPCPFAFRQNSTLQQQPTTSLNASLAASCSTVLSSPSDGLVSIQQQADDLQLSIAHGKPQSGVARLVFDADVHAGVQQFLDLLRVPLRSLQQAKTV